jgi:hypothetical protein
MQIILIALMLFATPTVEPGWHVVDASIEPGIYYTVGRECETIAYSDYWTPSRGISVKDGWGVVSVRETDYAFYTSCHLTIRSPLLLGIL